MRHSPLYRLPFRPKPYATLFRQKDGLAICPVLRTGISQWRRSLYPSEARSLRCFALLHALIFAGTRRLIFIHFARLFLHLRGSSLARRPGASSWAQGVPASAEGALRTRQSRASSVSAADPFHRPGAEPQLHPLYRFYLVLAI